MDLTLEKLEKIYEKNLSTKGDNSSRGANKDEVLSCLYFRISRIIENRGFISFELLIDTCDTVFKSFELKIDYDRNKHPESTLNQFRYIVDTLNSMKQIKIKSILY